MNDDKKVKRQALALLKKARGWFNSTTRLVTDWHNIVERDEQGEICRACIIGGLIPFWANSMVRAYCEAEQILDEVSGARFNFQNPHRLSTVHAIYDRAISKLEKELANG